MNGLLAHCRDQGLIDEAFLGQSVNVPDGFWDGLADCDLWSAAGTCDVAPADLRRFFDLFAANPRTITLFSKGINQSIRGTDQVNAIRSEEHTSELQSLMRNSYDVFCLKKKNKHH